MSKKKSTVEITVEVNGKQAGAEYQKIQDKIIELQKAQKKLTEGTKEYTDNQAEIKKLNEELKSLSPTYNQLQKQKKLIERELRNLVEGTEEYTQKSEELNEVTNRIKKMKKEWYGVRDAVEQSGKEIDKTGKKTGRLGRTMKGLKGFGKGVGRAFRFMLGPLGVLLGALGLLFGAFTKSEKGARFMAKATGAVNAVISVASKLVTGFIDKVSNIFATSKTPIQDFENLIKEGIVKRFHNASSALGSFKDAFIKFIKGDWDGARKELKETGEALVGVVTGMDGEELKEVVTEIKEQAKAFGNLELAKRRTAKANADLAVSIQRLANEEEMLLAIGGDATISFKEQQEALEKAMKLSEQRASKEIALAKNNLGLLNQEIALRKANGEDVLDLYQARADAIANVAAAEGALALTIKENEIAQRQLKQDLLEKNLDILIDGYDRQKTINEQLIADEELTFERRKEILDETKRLGDKSFLEQIETIKQFTDANIDANEFIKEQDADILKEKIRALGLSEIIEGRMLEIVNERKQANIDLKTVERELEQARIEAAEQAAETEKQRVEKEIADKILAKQKQFELEQLRLQEEMTEALMMNEQGKEAELLIQEEHDAKVLEKEMAFLEAKKEILNEYDKDDLAIRQEIADRKLEIEEQRRAKDLENEERHKAAKQAIMQQTTALVNDSFDLVIGFLSKDEEARKKNAKAIKTFEKAKVLTNLYSEVSAIWRNANSNPANALIPGFGVALATAQSAVAVGRSVLAIRNINAQQFATGGRVGKGNIQPLSNGDNVLATLKSGEVVLNEAQQMLLGGDAVFRKIGVPGFAEGGKVGQSTLPSVVPSQQTQDLVNQDFSGMWEEIKGLRSDLNNWKSTLKAFLVYDEFKAVEDDILGTREAASF